MMLNPDNNLLSRFCMCTGKPPSNECPEHRWSSHIPRMESRETASGHSPLAVGSSAAQNYGSIPGRTHLGPC
ncbi:unnamed protein product, partial [Brenthis ino]